MVYESDFFGSLILKFEKSATVCAYRKYILADREVHGLSSRVLSQKLSGTVSLIAKRALWPGDLILWINWIARLGWRASDQTPQLHSDSAIHPTNCSVKLSNYGSVAALDSRARSQAHGQLQLKLIKAISLEGALFGTFCLAAFTREGRLISLEKVNVNDEFKPYF